MQIRKYIASLFFVCLLATKVFSAADMGNTTVISPTDASNASGTCPSWSGSAAPSTLDDSGRCIQGAIARWWENTNFSVTSSGTAPTFAVAYTVAPAALRSGQAYCFTTHAAAAGSDTLNVNALGAKTLKKVVTGSKTNLAANDFYTGEKICAAYDGTDMVLIQKTTTDLSAYAALASANVFTADQTLRSTDAGATSGPILTLDRNSASPAASDNLGIVVFGGRDSGGNPTNYNYFLSTIVDPTNGSEDGLASINSIVAGVDTRIANFSTGIWTPNAIGGSRGADTINASGLFDDGVQLLPAKTLICTLTTTSGTAHSCTGISSAYRELFIEVAGVSTNNNSTLTLAVSDDNGLNYGTAQTISVASGGAAASISGTIRLTNIQGGDSYAYAHSITSVSNVAGSATNLAVALAEAGAGNAVINAIQFSTTGAHTYDAGTIRVYGIP